MKNLLFFTILTIIVSACGKSVNADSKTSGNTKKIEISIKGMSCTGCEETITKGALALDGVIEATASYVQGKAWIAYDDAKVSLEQIAASIEKKGYTVTGTVPLPSADSIQVQSN